MSPFIIFFIIVTIGYILYYAAIITVDMNAKPKDAAAKGETMEIPGEILNTDENGETEEPTSSEPVEENNQESEPEQTPEYPQGDDNGQAADPDNEYPSDPPLESSDKDPSIEEDDDIYGIDQQATEEDQDIPEHADNHVADEIPETDEEDESFLEAYKEQMRQHLVRVAQAEGAEIVDADIPDKDDVVEEKDDGFRGMIDSQNYDTGLADEINRNNESVETQSMTPVRQELFASTVLGAMYKMKDNEKQHTSAPSIDPDNIEKTENITKA